MAAAPFDVTSRHQSWRRTGNALDSAMEKPTRQYPAADVCLGRTNSQRVVLASNRQWHRSLLGMVGQAILLQSFYLWFQYRWSRYATHVCIGAMRVASIWDIPSPANLVAIQEPAQSGCGEIACLMTAPPAPCILPSSAAAAEPAIVRSKLRVQQQARIDSGSGTGAVLCPAYSISRLKVALSASPCVRQHRLRLTFAILSIWKWNYSSTLCVASTS